MNSKTLVHRNAICFLLLFLVGLIPTPVFGHSNGNFLFDAGLQDSADTEWLSDQLGEGLSARDTIASQVVAEEFTRQISNVEWLAPLAPVALSPFFGITLLSGLACFGPEWLPDNALLSPSSPLANPTLFWVFLVLTVVTSVPRFSKVSKPVAQLADFLETYSAIVILVALKIISSGGFETETASVAFEQQAGVLSMGWEGLVLIAMGINIFVINAVKFFFEILVWITPIPFLDACFEAANKSLCAGLMAIYAFSPVAALVFNILLFVCCALVFVWIRRREVFYRHILMDWVKRLIGNKVVSFKDQLVVFPKRSVGDIPARAKCKLRKSDGGLELIYNSWFKGQVTEKMERNAAIETGWWTNSIVWDDGKRLTFGSKYNDVLEQVAEEFEIVSRSSQEVDIDTSRQIEFA